MDNFHLFMQEMFIELLPCAWRCNCANHHGEEKWGDRCYGGGGLVQAARGPDGTACPKAQRQEKTMLPRETQTGCEGWQTVWGREAPCKIRLQRRAGARPLRALEGTWKDHHSWSQEQWEVTKILNKGVAIKFVIEASGCGERQTGEEARLETERPLTRPLQ